MKDRVFRDPVHGLVEFKGGDRPLAELLDTRPLQRLRRIKQMGFAWLVYPGAEHSRFGHALGAFHIAQRVTRRLELPASVALHVKVAALLHDVGHGPFSHAWEHVFPGHDHEHWGARIAAEHPELASALEALEPGLPATLRTFWGKGYKPHFARKLVSSQLDVDRLDYLLRDGHYSGAGYATYDLDWIIHAIQIASVRSGHDDPSDLVVDYRRGMYAVEQYLFARSYMYAQVYHHKTVRAAEWMFIKTLERFAQLARQRAEPPGLPVAAQLARGVEVPVEDYLRLHDVSVTTTGEVHPPGPDRSRERRPSGCAHRWPALAGRGPGTCPTDARRLSGACPAPVRRLSGACPAAVRGCPARGEPRPPAAVGRLSDRCPTSVGARAAPVRRPSGAHPAPIRRPSGRRRSRRRPVGICRRIVTADRHHVEKLW